MKNIKILNTIIIFTFFLAACGGGKMTYQKSYDKIMEKPDNQQDALFLLNAYNAAITLQELATIAPQQAYNNNLVQFTKNNYEMHEKIVDQLEDVADDMDVKLPEQPSPLYQSHLTILRNTDQEDFDDEFVDFISQVYENVYKDYKNAAVNANNEEVRVLAARFVSFQRENKNEINSLISEMEDN